MLKNLQNKKNNTSNSGFTMIELLVVATIITVLLSIGIVSYRQATVSSRNGRRKADLDTVRQALMLYKGDCGNFPPAASTFNQVVAELQSGGYISSSDNVEDPVNSGSYVYDYTGNGTCTTTACGSGACTFTLTANLEPSATLYTVSSP